MTVANLHLLFTSNLCERRGKTKKSLPVASKEKPQKPFKGARISDRLLKAAARPHAVVCALPQFIFRALTSPPPLLPYWGSSDGGAASDWPAAVAVAAGVVTEEGRSEEGEGPPV